MSGNLEVGDSVRLSGGYEMEPKWLGGKDGYAGTVVDFIPGQNQAPSAVVKLDHAITFDDVTGDIVILELRYKGAKWGQRETVHVELCNFLPDRASWKSRKRGVWIESHASYVKE